MKRLQKKTWSVILENKGDKSKLELLYKAYSRNEILNKVERDRVDGIKLISAKIIKVTNN